MTGEELIVLTADNLPVRVDQIAVRLKKLELDDVFYEGIQTGHGETALVWGHVYIHLIYPNPIRIS